jgi:predicted GIY-YIG superfamily endonuclease
MTKGVYLIHFVPAYKQARHYTGYADDIQRRVAQQQAGEGARLPQVAVAAGCQLLLVRVWPGADRKFERKLKKRKNAPRLCPICRGQPSPLDFMVAQ